MSSIRHAFSPKPAAEAAAAAAEAVAKMWKLERGDAAMALHEAFATVDPSQELSARPMALLSFVEEAQQGLARVSGEEGFEGPIVEWIASELEKSQKGIDAAWAEWLAQPSDEPREDSSQRHEAQRALEDCAHTLCMVVSQGWHKALLLWAERHPERRIKLGEDARESARGRQVLAAGAAALMLTPERAEGPGGARAPASERQVEELVESIRAFAHRSPNALAALVRHAGALRKKGDFAPASAVLLAQEALCAWSSDQNRMPWKRRKDGEREARSDADEPFFEALSQFAGEDPQAFWSDAFWSRKPRDEEHPGAVRDKIQPSPFETRWEMLRCASWQEPMGQSAESDTPWTRWWLALAQEAKAPGHPLAQANFSLGEAVRESLFKAPMRVDQTILRALKENLLDLNWDGAAGHSLGEWLRHCQSGAHNNGERGGDWPRAFAEVARKASFAPDGVLWDAHDSPANAAANNAWIKKEHGSENLPLNAAKPKERGASIAVKVALDAALKTSEKEAEQLLALAIEGFAALERAGAQNHAPSDESLSVESAWARGLEKNTISQKQRPRVEALTASIEAWGLGRVARQARQEAQARDLQGEEAQDGFARKAGPQRL